MGKPYTSEMASLPETYRSVLASACDPAHSAIRNLLGGPMIAVGSGGSLSGAVFAAELHERVGRHSGRAVTPLELRDLSNGEANTAYLLLSASGRNPDVLAAFRDIVNREPRRLVVLTAEQDTPLMKLVRRYAWVDCVVVPVPTGRDGFLAANSLLAFAAFLASHYSALLGEPPLPQSFEELLSPHTPARWREATNPLWTRENLIIIFSPLLRVAAVDLESKFTESALGCTQPADLRHFAHGRHHWLAKHGSTSAILALCSRVDHGLAEKTLRLLPASVPRAFFEFDQPVARAMLTALMMSFYLAGEKGRCVGIDPGRPGVPRFGSQIYRLTPTPQGRTTKAVAWRSRVLERKIGCSFTGRKEQWDAALEVFLDRLRTTLFGGAVFDYDGTLCDSHERFIGLNSGITNGMIRLLTAGIPIGIATGRGKSVRKALQVAIPAELWSQVLVGYYSGGAIVPLTEMHIPLSNDKVNMLQLAEELARHPAFVDLEPDVRFCQLSYAPRIGQGLENLWEELSAALSVLRGTGLRVFRSDHSVDVVAAGVSKSQVANRLRVHYDLALGCPILCVGDQARVPGNDVELLAEPLSLSVGSSSSSLDAGWNLSPPGTKGAGAMLTYFEAIKENKGTFRLLVKSLMSAL